MLYTAYHNFTQCITFFYLNYSLLIFGFNGYVFFSSARSLSVFIRRVKGLYVFSIQTENGPALRPDRDRKSIICRN